MEHDLMIMFEQCIITFINIKSTIVNVVFTSSTKSLNKNCNTQGRIKKTHSQWDKQTLFCIDYILNIQNEKKELIK